MSGAAKSSKAPEAVSRCPICGKPTVKAHRPFCSKRCAEIDLGRWLKGAYAVPGDPASETFSGISPDQEQD
ncbi:MAG: DNA gyrase inhibitor YacG [Pseudomonadota bacterium]